MIKITEDLIGDVSKKARASPRKRTNYNFHKSYDELFQRLLNAAEPGTYIRPHKHEDPDKVEAFVLLSGSVVVVEFDGKGSVVDHAVLRREKGVLAVEVPPRVWHSFICLEPGTVLYEAKEGPYKEAVDKNFASWAPVEGTEEAQRFNENLLKILKLYTT